MSNELCHFKIQNKCIKHYRSEFLEIYLKVRTRMSFGLNTPFKEFWPTSIPCFIVSTHMINLSMVDKSRPPAVPLFYFWP